MDDNRSHINPLIKANEYERILQIWDAFCQDDSDLVRQLLEEEVFFIVVTAETIWTTLPLDSTIKPTISWFLEKLIERFKINGNVIREIEIGGGTRVFNCASACCSLLSRISSGCED